MPKGYKEIEAFLVGGGGGANSSTAGGGGGGYTKTEKLSVSPGDTVSVNIGAGGRGFDTASSSPFFHDGNSTIVNSIESLGGKSTYTFTVNSGLSGGSGGGGAAWGEYAPGYGGYDGGNGGGSRNFAGVIAGGIGQGTTTRAFGESDGTLYAGGGGGAPSSDTTSGGSGGAGGGGNGGWSASNGQANTGGGAGGGKCAAFGFWGAASGGSGIAIIRWGY